ncbi:type II toxin-antitoxin system RelE/ParE family toxin [Anabaena azotica]|uniref:Type II toxin-antitoxin system RelE/ParE family toxin n=1 Tax=Anabaena azotica FACHB-119 TaxID=947527 RepID=A0ABR8D3G4_9NOST|nr:type II toxin-antitoxin system RelE/ParE family toxin [Anabaena azotica]MBD2500996.1 type II toxin-antitoxin system RelE/ParE family toxin [Anabaena azotica FACHB-119]
MIQSFKHKGIKKLFEDDDRKGVNPQHAEKLLDLLDRLDAAAVAEDMRFPGSGFHPLMGDRKGEYSVSVSGNWRLTFEFKNGDAYNVNYEDYH